MNNDNWFDCTLVTGCYDTSKFNQHALSPKEIIQKIDDLLKMPVYLIIFTDNEFKSYINDARESYGLNDKTCIITQELSELWSFQYLELVQKNREIYWPSRDARTNSESHSIRTLTNL